jgi:hypothetical protein
MPDYDHDMVQCPNGHQARRAARYCPGCGAPLLATPSAPPPRSRAGGRWPVVIIAASVALGVLSGATALAIGRSSSKASVTGTARCVSPAGDQIVGSQRGAGAPSAPSNDLTSVVLHADGKTLTAIFTVSGPVEYGDGLEALPRDTFAGWSVQLRSSDGKKPLYSIGVHQTNLQSQGVGPYQRGVAASVEALGPNEHALSGATYLIAGQEVTISQPLKTLSNLDANFRWTAGAIRIDGLGLNIPDGATYEDSCPGKSGAGNGLKVLDFPQKADFGAASTTTSSATSATVTLASPSTTASSITPPPSVPATQVATSRQFATFLDDLQNRIRLGTSTGTPIPDAVVTCPKPRPVLHAGNVIGCNMASSTVGHGDVLVHIHKDGGTDFDYVAGTAWLCAETPTADQKVLLDDLGIGCV